jgi:predicted short-subunit dehydrogenase-like oxidoreductase (DUF2520 family)
VEAGAITLIAVPDRVLAEVVAALAVPPLDLAGAIALHVSGAHSSQVLAPLRDLGASVGSLHPLCAFADRDHPPEILEQVHFGLEGDAEAVSVAAELVREMGGISLSVKAESKALYHAGAAVASNSLVALFDLAATLFETAGAPRGEAAPALLALMERTLENLRRLGSPAALTGPIERGDLEVVRAHVRALRELAPGCLAAYRALARRTVSVATAKGSIDAARARDLEEVLDGAEPP